MWQTVALTLLGLVLYVLLGAAFVVIMNAINNKLWGDKVAELDTLAGWMWVAFLPIAVMITTWKACDILMSKLIHHDVQEDTVPPKKANKQDLSNAGIIELEYFDVALMARGAPRMNTVTSGSCAISPRGILPKCPSDTYDGLCLMAIDGSGTTNVSLVSPMKVKHGDKVKIDLPIDLNGTVIGKLYFHWECDDNAFNYSN